MSDSHDPEPDPAALDELQRAFGEVVTTGDDEDRSADDDREVPAATAADAERPPDPIEFDVPDLEPDDSPGEPAEIVIVEQDPLVDEPDEDPSPPTIIRIDDYGGSTEVIDADHDPTPPDHDELVPADDEPIVISADDDLPDAVYVQGSLDEGSGRTIVFIDDDVTGDTVAPDADRDARRGIEPRLRARRAAIKRALGRRRLRWMLIGTFVVIVGVAALALLGSGLFAVKEENIVVRNAVYTDREALQAVIDDIAGTPALLVDIEQAEADLEAIPWVEDARVRVSFPHSATIEIRERAAMATYQAPDRRFRVLDRYGRVLDVRGEGRPAAYVWIQGPDPVDLEAGQFAPQGYVAAAELSKNLTSSIREHVEWIDVTADGSSLSLLLDDGTEVRFGAARDLFNKLLRLETTLANNPDLEPGVIDVSTSEVTF